LLKSKEMFRWESIAKRVAKASRKVLGDVEVYVFGGFAKGEVTAASDLDILIISGRLPRDVKGRVRVKEEIEVKAKLPLIHSVDIHLATPLEVKLNPIYKEALKTGLKIW